MAFAYEQFYVIKDQVTTLSDQILLRGTHNYYKQLGCVQLSNTCTYQFLFDIFLQFSQILCYWILCLGIEIAVQLLSADDFQILLLLCINITLGFHTHNHISKNCQIYSFGFFQRYFLSETLKVNEVAQVCCNSGQIMAVTYSRK